MSCWERITRSSGSFDPLNRRATTVLLAGYGTAQDLCMIVLRCLGVLDKQSATEFRRCRKVFLGLFYLFYLRLSLGIRC
jgi:hypothetical protein